MKYKRGKGRKPRRQQKVFKMKSGGGKFMLRGGKKSPVAGFLYTPVPKKKGGDKK